MPAPLVIAAWIGLATAVAAGAAGVTQTAIAANAAQGACESGCKDKCKAETGWLFSGRQKCIKACKADCANQANQPPPPPPPDTGINWWYVISGVLVVASILLFVFRKKIIKK